MLLILPIGSIIPHALALMIADIDHTCPHDNSTNPGYAGFQDGIGVGNGTKVSIFIGASVWKSQGDIRDVISIGKLIV